MPNIQSQAKSAQKQVRVVAREIKAGDIFSETSHYVFKGMEGVGNNRKYVFTHLGTQQLVHLDERYVENLLTTADQYHNTVEVTREDTHWTQGQIDKLPASEKAGLREGDLKQQGIRSIWAGIRSSDVFTVVFTTKPKNKTKKEYEAEVEASVANLLEAMSKAKTTAGIKAAAEAQFRASQGNPVLDYTPGDERKLRGFKVQFESINGIYDVIDMDLDPNKDPARGRRKVNINEIKSLVLHGVLYIVK